MWLIFIISSCISVTQRLITGVLAYDNLYLYYFRIPFYLQIFGNPSNTIPLTWEHTHTKNKKHTNQEKLECAKAYFSCFSHYKFWLIKVFAWAFAGPNKTLVASVSHIYMVKISGTWYSEKFHIWCCFQGILSHVVMYVSDWQLTKPLKFFATCTMQIAAPITPEISTGSVWCLWRRIWWPQCKTLHQTK